MRLACYVGPWKREGGKMKFRFGTAPRAAAPARFLFGKDMCLDEKGSSPLKSGERKHAVCGGGVFFLFFFV